MARKNNGNPANKVNYGTTVLTWRAPEYMEHERDEKWLMGASVAALVLIAWGIWQETYTFVIVILLLGGMYYLTHRHTPKEIDISLTTTGILAEGTFYPYTHIESFWVLYFPDKKLKTLSILLKSGLNKEISFQLGEQDPSEVKSFLGQHILELEDRTESIIEKLIRVLKL
jgi:hypothetical protein